MTEKLLTGTLRITTNKKLQGYHATDLRLRSRICKKQIFKLKLNTLFFSFFCHCFFFSNDTIKKLLTIEALDML